MQLTLPDFRSANLLIAGDIILDRYWRGDTWRVSPEAPVPVVRVLEDEVRPGGAGNVALNAIALGAHATLMGLVGKDGDAEMLAAQLTRQGVECAMISLEGQRTIVKLRVVSRNQQLLRMDFEDDALVDHGHSMQLGFQARLDNMHAVVLSDYAKGSLSQVQDLIALARNKNVPVIVDPKGNDFLRYRGATLLTPNQSEFEAVVGTAVSEADFLSRAEALCKQLSLGALLITRGAHGMLLVEQGHTPLHLPTQAREVFDVTGAGDTVVATLSAALAAGLPLRDAVGLSNLAAGIVVGKFGTATVTPDELAAAMGIQADITQGLVNEEQLADLVSRARRAGDRVVMTNGCFDVLHAGHVAYLKQASKLGDKLIVAVNDDDSVSRLKGNGRPVNPLSARMEVLAALAAVDWVVPFSEDTPERLICRILPDVLVKGGDYEVDQIAGAKCVQESGGEVRIMPFEQGYSTSGMIQSILERALAGMDCQSDSKQ